MKDAFENRSKSRLVKKIMETFNVSTNEAARILGMSVSYFNNKLQRNSFSIEDILMLSEYANCDLIVSHRGELADIYVNDFFTIFIPLAECPYEIVYDAENHLYTMSC